MFGAMISFADVPQGSESHCATDPPVTAEEVLKEERRELQVRQLLRKVRERERGTRKGRHSPKRDPIRYLGFGISRLNFGPKSPPPLTKLGPS
jgi:hypothetical protein